MAQTTVIQYVLKRLADHGVTDIFGVPGDYVYPVLDGILDDPMRLHHKSNQELKICQISIVKPTPK